MRTHAEYWPAEVLCSFATLLAAIPTRFSLDSIRLEIGFPAGPEDMMPSRAPSRNTRHVSILRRPSLLLWSALALAGAGGFVSLGTAEASGTVLPSDSEASKSGRPASNSPAEVVANLQQGLLWVMQNAQSLGFQGRYEYLLPIVQKDFDVTFMGSKSVGRHWKELDVEEQSEWLGQFAEYLTSNYAGQFNAWDGESFEMLGEEPAPRDTRVVLTRLIVPGSEDVVLNYRLRKDSKGQWRIIDIYLKGTVSELALRRSDFSSILKKKGFGQLVVAMNKKIAELRAEGGG